MRLPQQSTNTPSAPKGSVTYILEEQKNEAYLRHILSVLPEWPSNRVDELLPWNVVLTNK